MAFEFTVKLLARGMESQKANVALIYADQPKVKRSQAISLFQEKLAVVAEHSDIETLQYLIDSFLAKDLHSRRLSFL